MVQDPTTYEYKPDTSRTTWPQKTEYMYAGTKCTDASGNDVGDTTPYLKFAESDYTATITTKKTIYCTLYFANGRPALEVLKAKGGDYYAGGGNHTTVVDELYRFVGTASQVTNNYICLGASENPDTCKSDVNNMYRIIGVTTDGKLKVIKAKKYGSNQQWGANSWYHTWSDSPLKTYLNGTFYGSLDVRIKELIENHTWNMEYQYSDAWPSSNPTSSSLATDGTIGAKVGLMYASDYPNAGPNVTNNLTNWLFIQNGWSENSAEDEWTMTKGGEASSGYTAFAVRNYGSMYPAYRDGSLAVRPVFYLNTGNGSNVGLIGEGTVNIPYTITTIKS